MGGVPLNHPFLQDFQLTIHLGYPHDYGTPHIIVNIETLYWGKKIHPDMYIPSGNLRQLLKIAPLIMVDLPIKDGDFLQLCLPEGTQIDHCYPLVNVYITMENDHFQWVNPLFLWPCSITMFVYHHPRASWDILDNALSFHAGLRAQVGAVKRLASGTERNPLTKKPMCM